MKDVNIKMPVSLFNQPGDVSVSRLGRKTTEGDASLIEERIKELLAAEKDVVILHNTLFSQDGLFHQLAHSREERRKQKDSALYLRAKTIVNEMMLAAEAELRNRLS